MGNARARGTYAERKFAAMGRPAPVAPPAREMAGLLGGYEIRTVTQKDGVKVVRKFTQKPGLYRSADGRLYRYDGVSIRRAREEA